MNIFFQERAAILGSGWLGCGIYVLYVGYVLLYRTGKGFATILDTIMCSITYMAEIRLCDAISALCKGCSIA